MLGHGDKSVIITHGDPMYKKLLITLLMLVGVLTAQPPTTFTPNTIASSTAMNANLSGLYVGRVGRWVGAGAPGSLPFSIIGDVYFDTNVPGTVYTCYRVPCTAVGANNWVLPVPADTAVTPGSYTAANITVDQKGRVTAAANGITGLTTNRLLKAASATLPGNSSVNDDGTTVSTSEDLVAKSFTTNGGSPPTCPAVGCIGLTPKAVASLGTCNGAAEGTIQIVNDATGPTFLATVVSGGSTRTPVMCNGTNWVAF